MLIALAVAGIVALILLLAVARLNAFLAFLVVCLGVGLAAGLSPTQVSLSIQKGLGDTLGSLAIVIGLGAMLGKIVAESGAAQRIATSLMRVSGPSYVQWALMVTGFIVGLPLFYAVGFVLVIPVIFSVAAQYRLPTVYVGLPMLAALSVTHGYLPPHPAPAALVQQFHADMGLTLLYGVVIAIPAILLAGPVYSRFVRHIDRPPLATFTPTLVPDADLPSLGASLCSALLPVGMLATGSVLVTIGGADQVLMAGRALSDPTLAMLCGVLAAVALLGRRQGRSLADVMTWCERAVADIASMLLVVGGAGAFKQVLTDAGASTAIASALLRLPAPPLVLAWVMAGLVRVCVGSATVAGLTTAGLVAPLVISGAVDPNLMVLAIGAGSLLLSHVNDGAFWLFKEYFALSVAETLQTWTAMETIVAIVGLAGVLVLDVLIH
ncbi:MAG: gluconate transporter [Acidobacteria bacterium]|nr:gluconate transporter [Acidobacteriota bacterium]